MRYKSHTLIGLSAAFAAALLAGCGLGGREVKEAKQDPPPQAAATPSPSAVVSPEAAAAAAAKEAAVLSEVLKQVGKAKTDYRLAPADLVSVTVYQDPEMNRKVRVNTNGAVSMPLIGAVQVGGMTLAEAQAAIEAKLSKFLVSPQVSLFIEDYGSKTIFVMGEVQKPGSYPIPTEQRMTVLEAISTAGGFTPVAAQDRTRVLRNSNGASTTTTINVREITQEGHKEKDMVLEPNDIVYVPQTFF